MQNYLKEYTKLNDKQKEAVDKLEGPLLVVAGPGTGKTQLLAMRVANILRSTDTEAANILCLTFTNKAAVNMKERIIELAGAPAAKTVVKTFHSFAAEIMNSHSDYFWSGAQLNIAPDSVQLDIIESIVANLPLDNPLALKFAGQYTLINDIQKSISLAKDAGLTPAKLKSIIEANLAYIDTIEPQLIELMPKRLNIKQLDELTKKVNELPDQSIEEHASPLISLSTVLHESLAQAVAQDVLNGKTTETGKWKRRFLQTVDGQPGMFDERKRNLWWLALTEVYEEYRQIIHQRGFYDYADMLVEVISQLENHPQLRAEVQERFLYVLIDEFQDTNPAQLRLAHLIADHYAANGRPNLMAVGDDDQSIFKFNGAELNNMLGFQRSYPMSQPVVLVENYRSSQAVLDIAKLIIEQAEDRLVKREVSLSKDLVAKSDIESGQITALSYSSRELQLSSVARLIKKNYRTDKTIAVLARNHDGLIKISAILAQLKVPIRYEQQSNILEHEIIDQIYLLSKILVSIKDGDKTTSNSLIHQLIRHPMWQIPAARLWQLAVNNANNPDWINSLLNSQVKDEQALGAWLINLSQEADIQPLAVTLEQLIGLKSSKGYFSPLRQYFMQDKTKANKYLTSISAIQLLRALVHEFSVATKPTLADFIRLIEVNRDNHKIIADESPFITGNHAVQLLTIHKAKGLEFDSVYLIDAVENNWSPSFNGRKPPANLPLLPPGEILDDYIRLMYVALTRAKSDITVSSYYQDHAGKEVADSPIVQAAFEIKKIDEQDKTKIIEIIEEHLYWPQLDEGEEKAMLKARLETYSLSVTHLFNFLNVAAGGPQYFKEKNLLRLPELKSVHLSYGTAMHDAMEAAQKLTNGQNFNLKAVQAEFARSLENEQLTKAEYAKFLKQGKQILSQLFNEYKYELPMGSQPEQEIVAVRLDKAVIRGKLDRLDKTNKLINIVDYKTGKPLTSFTTNDKTKQEKAWRAKTQLIFYAILLQNASQFAKVANQPITGQMVYIEAENRKQLELTYTPSQEDIDQLKKLIEVVYGKIINLDLPDISKYPPDFEGTIEFVQDLIKSY